MKSKFHQLDYVINIEKFQKIQDDIAKATDMAVIAIDYTGNPITRHSSCSEFCATVRKDSTLSQNCEKCDSRGGLEAARNKEAYIYLCHLGIVDFAIPIIVDEQYLGAIMAGQIRLEDENNNQELERIVSKRYQLDFETNSQLKELHEQLHVMSLGKIKAVAQMIHHLVNYIVGEAVLKTSLYEANQQLYEDNNLSNKNRPGQMDEVHLYYQQEGDDVVKGKARDSSGTRDAKADEFIHQILDEVPKSSLLRPALKYIQENLGEKIYLDKMAYLCNISPSYFSKIFKRETGYNFSAYVIQAKILEAKKILETTQQPILNISMNLGFEDCGYFIRLFKKEYGVTPAHYRNVYNEKTMG